MKHKRKKVEKMRGARPMVTDPRKNTGVKVPEAEKVMPAAKNT